MNKPLTYKTNRAIIRKIEQRACVYVIAAGNYLKIGVSKSIDERLSELQTANPLPLKLIFHTAQISSALAYRLERSLHLRFREYRTQGEWFEYLSADEIAAAAEETLPRLMEPTKRPWSGPEAMCAACGAEKPASELDDNFTCLTCIQRKIEFQGSFVGPLEDQLAKAPLGDEEDDWNSEDDRPIMDRWE